MNEITIRLFTTGVVCIWMSISLLVLFLLVSRVKLYRRFYKILPITSATQLAKVAFFIPFLLWLTVNALSILITITNNILNT